MHRNLIRYVTTPDSGDGGGQGGNAQNDGSDQGGTGDHEGEFKPITSQDELNSVLADRLSRERAKFSDYRDLKAKAKQFDELTEQNKTEVQKATDAKTAAEAERDQARTEALRLRIATKHGVSDDDADLFLTGTDEETLTRQAKRLAEHSQTRRKNGNTVRSEGGNPKPGEDEDREFVRGLFGSSG